MESKLTHVGLPSINNPKYKVDIDEKKYVDNREFLRFVENLKDNVLTSRI